VADPGPSLPTIDARPSSDAPKPSDSAGNDTPEKPEKPGKKNPGTEPHGTSSSTATPEPSDSEPPACRVRYDLVNQWPDGFQATITVTTHRALDSWRVAWSFRDGQKVGQMWDASFAQDGSRVTATAADYNKSVAADGSLAFGFLASWRGKNSPGYDFTLNGHSCVKA
jgi:cellulase/cellobiase CelA1